MFTDMFSAPVDCAVATSCEHRPSGAIMQFSTFCAASALGGDSAFRGWSRLKVRAFSVGTP